jgi:4-hydroxybenzoate polyprenyltransferase
MKKVQGFFGLIRPFTLLAPFMVSINIIIASFFYSNSPGPILSEFFKIILPASFCFALLNGASNALNQATDKRADCISKSYRPIPQGIISVKEAYIVSIIMYVVSFYFGMLIHPLFVLFIGMITFFTFTYSLSPRMKDKLWLNQLWIAIPRGFLGILASWSVYGSIFDPLPLVIACIAGLFLFGGSITKDVADKNADRLVGTRTLVNIYGEEKAAFMVLPFLFFPFLLIPITINLGFIPSYFWCLTFLSIPGFIIFKSMINKKVSQTIFENTTAWTCMYTTYLIFAISFSVITVLGTILFI